VEPEAVGQVVRVAAEIAPQLPDLRAALELQAKEMLAETGVPHLALAVAVVAQEPWGLLGLVLSGVMGEQE